MIKSWKHKGLRNFFMFGSTKGIQSKHAQKLQVQLSLLHAAVAPEDMNLPGYRFHGLLGKQKGIYSVTVNSNWRLTFCFEGKDAVLVNYEDYH